MRQLSLAELTPDNAGQAGATARTVQELRMVRMLASVATLEEADQAVALGADLVDLKDPARGALGAWPVPLVRAAVTAHGGRRPLSATVGDLPMEPELLHAAAASMAATGVDYVKVGFFAGGNAEACAAAMAPLAAGGVQLVAVMMADQQPRLDLLAHLAAAGWHGAMLDTADKRAGGLRTHLAPDELAAFVAAARAHRLLVGLAGSLGISDVPPLAALEPDYLGFRGALCRGPRTSGLDAGRLAAVRAAMATASPAPA
ncbi:(5-formylfuran-3-yl)methyl phosphate synthase [Marinimicrococcus flavescens]|uniref:(5-formylfuran-3-yl)methyl phosphate synthase n=1 Tax=Marinimicrococcus flavescens TaxID=3031815 RepID=A0AAP3V091_9PROT|nr:(5-formylfuran-3-yl)methyl phosphate synthase [Marinimicrococcus flavescens]